MLAELYADVKKVASKERAIRSKSFFKTGPGEYAEGDAFIGISVPQCREIAKKYQLSYEDISQLLNREEHELRLIGLLKLVDLFDYEASAVYKFTLKHISRINNWDLVDSSAPSIIGKYLLDKPRDILYKWVYSKNLWERRIAIVSTLTFIRNNEFDDTIALSKILLQDEEDLIRKAVGWMLREVGKKDKRILLDFLANYADKMPSIMRSYAMEHLPKTLRTTIRKQATINNKK